MGRVDVWGGDLLSALVRHFLLDLTKMKKQHRGFGPEKWNIHPTLHDFEKIKTYWLIGCERSGEKWSARSGLDQECSLGRVIATKQTEGVCGRRVFWGSLRDWGNSVLSTSPILTSLIIPGTLPGTHCYSNFICFFKVIVLLFSCVCVCLCAFLCTTCIRCPQKLEEDSGSLGTGVTHDCEPLCGCWGLTPGPLWDQYMLLTAEPFLQLHYSNFKI